jgi:hypothetical protein
MIRSSLARHQPKQMDTEKLKREAWHLPEDEQVLVMPVKDPRLTWELKQMVLIVGNAVYGKGPNAK